MDRKVQKEARKMNNLLNRQTRIMRMLLDETTSDAHRVNLRRELEQNRRKLQDSLTPAEKREILLD